MQHALQLGSIGGARGRGGRGRVAIGVGNKRDCRLYAAHHRCPVQVQVQAWMVVGTRPIFSFPFLSVTLGCISYHLYSLPIEPSCIF